MTRRRKRSFLTLVEVMVALSLLGLILGVLSTFYRRLLHEQQEVRSLQVHLQKSLFFKQRMEKLFLLFVNTAEDATLFTPDNLSNSLYFEYRGEADPSPWFSGEVRSLLYLDSQKKLCLTTWSSNEEKYRTEQLYENISQMTLTFFDEEKATWQSFWPKEAEHLPLWVKIVLTCGKEDKIFFFQPCLPEGPILYLDNFANKDSS